ncbi:MAG TPA: hypothetical protein VNT60_05615 [Deinococcales bacterium]|nr:hypothetical protein [Deinococcales bacterium]
MKKAISNRDLERIGSEAGVPAALVRATLALEDGVPEDVMARVEAAVAKLNYAVSMRDRVAMAAGTSIATVNRAYRAEARHLVRPDLLERISETAVRLGYVPDVVARRQRAGGTHIIAVCPCLPDLADAEASFLLRALSESVIAEGQHPVIAPIPDHRLLPDIALSAVSSGVILFEDGHARRRVTSLLTSGRTVVLLGAHPRVPSARVSWEAAFRDLAAAAVAGGYRVLHLGRVDASLSCADRVCGVVGTLRASGSSCEVFASAGPGEDMLAAAGAWRADGAPDAAAALEWLAASGRLTVEHRAPVPGGESPAVLDEVERLRPSPERRVAVLCEPVVDAARLLRLLRERHAGWLDDRLVGVAGYGDPCALAPGEADGLALARCSLSELAEKGVRLLLDVLAQGPDAASPPPVQARFLPGVSL